MSDPLLDRLHAIVDRFSDVEAQLADPDVMGDSEQYTGLLREHADLAAVVALHRDLEQARSDLDAAREMARGEAVAADRDLMAAEATKLDEQIDQLTERLRVLLLPADPDDDRDVIVEVRAAAGGDEAGLFAAELVEMYRRFAQARRWQVESLSESSSDIGGIKESVFEVKGSGAWAALKHESGVHRVQRVPSTESQGRIHTSTASVAVLPVAEEVDVDIDPNDLRIDVFRSSGPGGQSVNTTDSAVRITHQPSGLVVSCQDQKSQHQNRDKAMRILRSRLLDAEMERAASERADARRVQIGTGDRAEKIRTYNFPQSRVTDHRIGLTLHSLSEVMGGELGPIIEALREVEQQRRLEAMASGSA